MKTFDVKLDVEKALYSPMQILFNVSGDDIDSVQLNFEFVQDEEPFDLTGYEIQLGIKKPSGKVVYQYLEITTALEGNAVCRLSNTAYDEQGIATAEVYIRDATETIVVSPFYFNTWDSFMQTTEEVPPPTGDVYWQNVLNKPLTYPPSEHLHEIADVLNLQDALDSKANVGETGGGVPADHTHEIADVTGLQTALDGKSDVGHTQSIASVTGLQSALDGKVDDIQLDSKANLNHVHAIQDVTGLQTALDGKADDIHAHAIADVTGLQTALDGKMNSGSAYLKAETYSKAETYAKTEVYSKAETYNRTQIDAMAFPEGGGGTAPIVVEDNLISTDPTTALSSNQGRILNETKAGIDHLHDITDVTGLQTALDGKVDDAQLDGKSDVGHVHTSIEITDFATAVADSIPLEYLTESEGDTRYQASGTVPAHTHDEYLTQAEGDALFLTPTEGDGLYQPIGTVPAHTHDEYLTQAEGDALFLTPTEGDIRYQASGTVPAHDHPEYLTAIPPEYLTETEGDGRYQAIGTVPAHNHTVANITDFPTTMTPPLMQSGTRGGARVGNGLGMSGEYLTVKSGAGLVTSGTTYQVEVDRVTTDGWYVKNATGQNLTIWKGTQSAYDLLTKDPNTLYFIVG